MSWLMLLRGAKLSSNASTAVINVHHIEWEVTSCMPGQNQGAAPDTSRFQKKAQEILDEMADLGRRIHRMEETLKSLKGEAELMIHSLRTATEINDEIRDKLLKLLEEIPQ